MNVAIRSSNQNESPVLRGRSTAAAAGRRVNARDAEWLALTTRLGEALGCLEAGQFLILQTRDDEPYYVQFAAGGAEGLKMEAVSNRFLQGWRQLDDVAHGRLRRLGWRPPTDIGDGPVNWWRLFPAGCPMDGVADLAVATLRKVFEVPRPGGLVYHAFTRRGEEILLPTLGLEREPARLPLEERVGQALAGFLGSDEMSRDEDGDWPIRCGEHMVYVRVVAERGYVALFAPALLEVEPNAGLVDAVNEFNNSIRGARAAFTGQTVVVAAEVDDQPEVGHSVVNSFKAVSSLAQSCADELQGRFGGRRYFGERTAGRGQGPGYGFYL
jgi:hypothetical protein